MLGARRLRPPGSLHEQLRTHHQPASLSHRSLGNRRADVIWETAQIRRQFTIRTVWQKESCFKVFYIWWYCWHIGGVTPGWNVVLHVVRKLAIGLKTFWDKKILLQASVVLCCLYFFLTFVKVCSTTQKSGYLYFGLQRLLVNFCIE